MQGRGADHVLTGRWTPSSRRRRPQLKIVANHAVGFDNVNIQLHRGENSTNTPDVLTETTADTAFAISRPPAASARQRFLRGGTQWMEALMMLGQDGMQTIGIVGFGRSGRPSLAAPPGSA